MGNIEIEAGASYDSGLKYVSGGVAKVIKKSFVDFGALPATALKEVAHGLSVDPAFAKVELIANDGTTSKVWTKNEVTIDATNISVTTTASEVAWSGIAIVHHIEA